MARHSVLICERGLTPIPAGEDRSFEHVFAPFDADLGIVDLNHVDQGLQISLAERNRSGGCDESEDKMMASRSGWNSRSFMWVVTRLSSLAIGIDRPLQTVLPFRAQVEHV